MWTLKDIKLKQKLNVWFTDEEIDKACRQFMTDICPDVYISKKLSPACGEIEVYISKNEFNLSYDPFGWNPYPQVKPPAEGKWLVQDTRGNIEIREFHSDYDPEGCNDWWTKTPSYEAEAVAFMALPKPYTENKK